MVVGLGGCPPTWRAQSLWACDQLSPIPVFLVPIYTQLQGPEIQPIWKGTVQERSTVGLSHIQRSLWELQVLLVPWELTIQEKVDSFFSQPLAFPVSQLHLGALPLTPLSLLLSSSLCFMPLINTDPASPKQKAGRFSGIFCVHP